MSSTAHLISTRKLKGESKEKLLQLGFSIEDYDFVEIRYTVDKNKEDILIKNLSPIIFTSQRAVGAIEKIVPKLQQRNAFAIEGVTTTDAKKAGFTIIGTARDAGSLAEVIIKSAPESTLHITSNIRRNELERGLSEAHIPMQILEVYEKVPHPRKVQKFDAVLFWSPSQVDAFLSENPLESEALIFSIGNTTTTHLRRRFFENVITVPESSEERMIEAVMNHFIQQ